MTDKQEQTSDNNIEDAESQANEGVNQTHTDDLDIEGALAAVASLQDLTRKAEPDVDEADEELANEEEAVEIEAFERIDSDELESDSVSDVEVEQPIVAPDHDTMFPRPPLSVLHRGQLASVVPALLLIGIGAYLTFIVTTSEAALEAPVVVAVLVGGLGAMLLAQWISSSRWSIGSFFIGVLLLLTGGTAAYLAIPNNLSLVDGYPLLLTALGTAFVLTDVFVPSGKRIWLIGLILAIAGLAGVAVTTTLLEMSLAQTLSGLFPAAIVIVIVLLIAPFVRRRQ